MNFKKENRILFTLLLILVFWSPFQAKAQQEKAQEVSVFQQPALHRYEISLNALIRAGKTSEAEAALLRLVTKAPYLAMPYYTLAKVYASEGKEETAYSNLDQAIKLGFYRAEQFEQDPGFAPLRETERFAEFVKRAQNAYEDKVKNSDKRSMRVRDGRALVTELNTRWNAGTGFLETAFVFDDIDRKQDVQFGKRPVAVKLREWVDKGLAAGNVGDLYDNRDRKHSFLPMKNFPQLSEVIYSEFVKQTQLDYGANSMFLFNANVIGNSSTALRNGIFSRSFARAVQDDPYLALKQYNLYMQNHLYIYPAVNDYTVKTGDRFNANTPYIVISKGKSGSDRPFMHAMVSTLAAFKPEVKAYLRQKGLIVPTLQQILRHSYQGVDSNQEYLSPKAHPIVFDGEKIDVMKMITLAQNMTLETVPPFVGLQVVGESGLISGIDDFVAGYSEQLFDSPGAIARVVRSVSYEKQLIVRAGINGAQYDDPDVKLHWVVMNGDEDRIQIKPMNDFSSEVQITVPWHERHALKSDPEVMSNRVEIAVFVQKGDQISAPAFVNLLYPSHQKRTYDKDGRILRLEHEHVEYKDIYMDPKLFPTRAWTDIYEYNDAGILVGWERIRANDKLIKHRFFTQKGKLITAFNPARKPKETVDVSYEPQRNKNKTISIVERVN